MIGYSKQQQLGRKTKAPKRAKRGQISKEDYSTALEVNTRYDGSYGCYVCGKNNIEMHHVMFRSQGGRGKWRNLLPLCKEHHEMAHKERELTDQLKEHLTKLHGPHYYKDEWDLYDEGLIDEPTVSKYEKFMEGERQ